MYPFGPIVEEKMDNLGDDQIIVLLEGDISDLDIEFSDDENDVQVNNIDYPSVDWNVDFNASLGDNFENNNDFERNENQLSFEHILPQEQSYFSSDDDSEVPLSVRYNKYRKSLPKWIKKDIDFVHTDFDDCFTRSEDDLTQYNYFKKFIDSKILEEMVYHTNLYSTQKTGSSINTTVLEMETFIGIHIYSGIVKMPSYRISYKLVRELKDDGIYTLGTIRSNRVSGCNLQNYKVMKNNGRGSHDYLTDANSNIIFLKWFDNKPVHLISSYVGVEPMDMVKRWSGKKVSKGQETYSSRPSSHYFRSQIALALIQSGKTPTRKRGRLSEGNKLPTIKTPRIQRPVDDVRYDQIGHMPTDEQRCRKNRSPIPDCRPL
ncbi:hypothetical protein QTP88_015183 [Uroleucon formosanum]